MKLKPTLLALALCACFGSAYAGDTPKPDAEAARQQLDKARAELHDLTRRIAELSAQLGDHGPRAFAFEFAGEPRRALIGVVLAPDEHGAKIAAVTPGGPAAKAGLKAGDLIVAVNGKTMGKSSAAVDAVRDTIGALEAGAEVALRYQRDGKTLDAKLVAERREPGDWVGMLDLPPMAPHAKIEGLPRIERDVRVIVDGAMDGMPKMRQFKMGPMGEHLRFLGDGGLDLNLTTLNAALGKYFGTDQGVLVLENEGEKLPQIKAGDVIQIIDGKPVDSVPDAMRQLTAKEPGQMLNVEVLRERKRVVLAIEAPERDELFFRVPMPPPTPAAAPTPSPAPRAAMPRTAPVPAVTPTPPPPPKAVRFDEHGEFEWKQAQPIQVLNWLQPTQQDRC